MTRGAVAGAALLLLVAGCTVEPPAVQGDLPGRRGGAPGNGTAGPDEGAGPGAAVLGPGPNETLEGFLLPAPLWARGDSWRFTIDAGDGGGAQTLVVYGETAADYLVGTADPQDAVATAFFGRSLPGRVGKQFLSGYDGGVPTRFFDFPLQQNKTWVLHVRAGDFHVRANYTPSVDGGRGPGFAVEGVALTGERVATVYAPQVKWMTRFQLTGSDGQAFFTRTLAGYSANYTGPYYNAEATDLYLAERSNATVSPQPVDSFTQPRPFTELHLQIAARGTDPAALADVRVLDPAGAVRYNFTATGDRTERASLPSVPGNWQVLWSTARMDVQVRVAGIDVQGGTL